VNSTSAADTGGQSPPASEFDRRCDTIEEAYEFFLAYASKGLPSDHPSASAQPIRDYLRRCHTALNGLGDVVMEIGERLGLDAPSCRAFAAVIARDAQDAAAAIQLVLSLASIGSQVVDNLNASIHLRALLTDLFLIDEVLKTAARPQTS
jgi:hypothetical protein